MQFLRESMLTRYLYCLKVKNCYGTATKTDTIDKQNKIESPEVNPHTNGQLIYEQGGKYTQWKKDHLFKKWCWENWSTTCKRMKLEHSDTIHKNKLKMD